MFLSRPMLAATLEEQDLASLRFPLLASPKLDGVRCFTMGGRAWTRAYKLVPNLHVQRQLSTLPDGLDGELIAGTFNQTQSAVMSQDGEPEFVFHVFDWFSSAGFYARNTSLFLHSFPGYVQPLRHEGLYSLAGLLSYEEECLRQGFEGVMLRDPEGPYLCKRSSVKEGYLLKLKRYKDAEARIVGFREQMENTNEQEPDAFGYMKRPGGRANHLPKGTLGSFLLRDVATGTLFHAGSGLSDEERQRVWDNKEKYLGAVVTYRYQELGPNGKPRFPRIVGVRHD